MSTSADSKKEIDRVANQLRAAAVREPANVRLQASMILVQIRNYADGDDEYRAALKPGITESIRVIERMRGSGR